MVRISNYSRDALTELLAEVPLDFDLREQGTLQLFRTEKQVKGSKADQEVLAEFDSPFEVLDRDGCIAVEPGLAHRRRQVRRRPAADRRPHRRLPDVHPRAGRDRRRSSGVGFRYGVTIKRLAHRGRPHHRRRHRPRAARPPTPMSARSGPTRRSC